MNGSLQPGFYIFGNAFRRGDTNNSCDTEVKALFFDRRRIREPRQSLIACRSNDFELARLHQLDIFRGALQGNVDKSTNDGINGLC